LEISEAIFEPGHKPSDRNDLIVRVFNMKLEELLHDIKDGTPFGHCNAGTNFHAESTIILPKVCRLIHFPCLQVSKLTI
jgi:hypothetical protein